MSKQINIPACLKLVLKVTLKPLKYIKQSLPKLKLFMYRLPEYIFFGDLRINYLGFKLFYSRGTSLINRVRFGRIYEPDVTATIIKKIQHIDKPVLLDVGANIGLISLNVIKSCPRTKVIAFEPGEHQYNLFSKTIEHNKLSKNIKLEKFALSDKNGISQFSIHSGKDASGDGFKDTNRAGPTNIIQVPTKKLDDWWLEHSCVHIDFIKIDTEGAELLVLIGGNKLLNAIKPIILLEICKANLKVYEYDHLTIYNFLINNNYALSTLSGIEISEKNFDYYLDLFEEFLAIPNH